MISQSYLLNPYHTYLTPKWYGVEHGPILSIVVDIATGGGAWVGVGLFYRSDPHMAVFEVS